MQTGRVGKEKEKHRFGHRGRKKGGGNLDSPSGYPHSTTTMCNRARASIKALICNTIGARGQGTRITRLQGLHNEMVKVVAGALRTALREAPIT